MPGPQKVPDKLFWEVIESVHGAYSMAVRVFKDKYDITISRIAVRERCLNHPDKYNQIKEAGLDIAEHIVFRNMKQKKNLNVSQRSAEFYLKTQGKGRGYYEKKDESQDTGDSSGGLILLPDGSEWDI